MSDEPDKQLAPERPVAHPPTFYPAVVPRSENATCEFAGTPRAAIPDVSVFRPKTAQ